jgi:hypothetical protein
MSDPRRVPSRKNCTEVMPTVEVGTAVTGTVLVTMAPFKGDVIATDTPVALITRVTGIFCGEPVAPAAVMVAVALWVPAVCPVGFTMKETEVEAFDPSDPDAGAKVSHACVELADQERVLFWGPVFLMITV